MQLKKSLKIIIMKTVGILLVIVAVGIFVIGAASGNMETNMAVTGILVGILGVLLTIFFGKKKED